MPLTRQEIFDKAYLGLAAQGFTRSLRSNVGICAYRGDDGKRCAIGHCIPDEIYRSEMDKGGGMLVARMMLEYKEIGDLFDGDDITFLNLLQGTHDGAFRPVFMEEALGHFAVKNGLDIPEIPES